jgi:hypothetical protein
MSDERDHPKRPGHVLATVAKTAAGISGEPVAQALAGMLEIVQNVRWQRYQDFVAEVSQTSSMEELLEGVGRDERATDMFVDAAQAAMETDLRRKRSALAKVLREGLFREDDAELDEERVILRALGPLDVVHLRILDLMHQAHDIPGGPSIPLGSPMGFETFAKLYPQAARLIPTFMTQLAGWGIIEDSQVTSRREPTNARWIMTNFGERVYGFLADTELRESV